MKIEELLELFDKWVQRHHQKRNEEGALLLYFFSDGSGSIQDVWENNYQDFDTLDELITILNT